MENVIPVNMCGSMSYVPIEFPKDEGSHYKDTRYGNSTYKRWYEWWYFNGKLKTTDNRNFGYMIVVFHFKYKGILIPQGNMLIIDLDNKKSCFSYWNANPVLSTFSQERLDIQLKRLFKDNNFYKFHAYSSTQDSDLTDIYSVVTKGKAKIEPGKNRREEKSNMGLDLTLERDLKIKPFLINGNGIMNMPDGGDSYYYTFPHLKTDGKITLGNETFEIASGDSWMEHQWGDFNINEFGWEWFSLRLENKIDANVFIHIDKNKKVVNAVANFIMPNDERKVLNKDDFSVTAREGIWMYNAEELSDHSGINKCFEGMTYPQMFMLDFPSMELSATIKSISPLQYGYWYWEGYCNVYAKWKGEKLSGFSYTELYYPKK